MAYVGLSTSPRKVVPLSGGLSSDMQRTKSEGSQPSTTTRRAYFCAVVVEGGQHGQLLAQDVQELITSLGEPMMSSDNKMGMERSTSAPDVMGTASLADVSNDPSLQTRKRSLTTTSSELQDVINELVSTERSYVARLHTLKNSYADPLRNFARSKDSAILPPYEAKTLFGNIDQILPANEAFLTDLEKMVSPNGHKLVGGVGDVALKHIKDLKAFDCYKQYYAKREEAQTIFEREMAKKSTTGFAGFIDRIKYSSTDTKNRVGLRELLMDPVQRIPRYTLMFRTMIKHMSPSDPQRQRLMEADELAAKIALFETDDQTKRATIMYCLERSIEGFPANLISNSRRFIDCIDVEDAPVDSPANGYGHSGDGPGGQVVPLQCTLFLFDDRLLIVKRPSGGATGKALSGLDEMDRVAKMGGLPSNIKKGVMSCKGVVDITEVVATDVTGPDFHLFLEDPPEDQSDRWSGRPFRSLSVVHPPHGPNFDPVLTKQDKQRFLQNLWTAQALYRVKGERSVALAGWSKEMNVGKGRSEIVRTYFNVYQRMDWLKEPKKCKVVVHIDAIGAADPLPFGVNGPPLVIARAQPMAGELCRYTVTSNDPNDEAEEDIIHNATLQSRIVQTIHQFGVFKFRPGRTSTPGTPTASSTRSRAAIFGLDAISRTLKTSDVFGIGSLSSSHRRAKSSTSRASTYTMGTESSAAKSSRSNSTAGTSISIMDMGDSHAANGHKSHSRRGRSPGPGYALDSGSDPELLERPSSRLRQPVQSNTTKRRDERPWYAAGAQEDWNETEDEMDDDSGHLHPHRSSAHASIGGLEERLELARQNSQTQEIGPSSYKVKRKPVPLDTRDERMLEDLPSTGELSELAQCGSMLSDVSASHYPSSTLSREAESITPTPSCAEGRPQSPTKRSSKPHRSRSVASTSSDRESKRPMGPRPISPMPTSPRSNDSELKASDIEAALRKSLAQMPSRPVTPSTTGSISLSRQSTTASQRPTSPPLDSGRPMSPSLFSAAPAAHRATTPAGGHRPKTPHELPPLPVPPGSVRAAALEIERVASPTPQRRWLPEAIDKTPQPLPPPTSMVTPKMLPPLDLGIAPKTPCDPTTSTPIVPPLSIKKRIPQSPPTTAKKCAPSPSLRNSRRLSAQPKPERKETVEDLMEDIENKTLPPDTKIVPTSSTSSVWQITSLAQSTKDDISSSRRSVKKIKLEVDAMKLSIARELSNKDKVMSRLTKGASAIPRSPHSRDIATKAAEARLEEMQLAISARRSRPMSNLPVQFASSATSGVSAGSSSVDLGWLDEWSKRVEELTDLADHDLQQASSKHDHLLVEFKVLAQQFEEKTKEVDRTRGELSRAKKQCELVKKLLADATAENEVMYEAFNEELDGMFNDAELPETEAWDALTRDLRQAKEARNAYAKDNSSLKRKLEEVELQNRQWEELLRSHGLIS